MKEIKAGIKKYMLRGTTLLNKFMHYVEHNVKMPTVSSPKAKVSVGLDIGSSCIKLVVLEIKGKEKILQKISSLAIKPKDDLKAFLDSFLKSHKLSTNGINIALSGPSVIIRYISMPKMSLQDLRSTLQYEAKEYIPFPLEEVMLDCAIVKEKTKDNNMLVLLVAVKKSAIQERIDLLEKIGLSARLIDIDSVCLANVFTSGILANKEQEKKSNVVGLLNIGSKFTNMVIIDNGILQFSRDIVFGGDRIAKKVTEVYGADFARVEMFDARSPRANEVFSKIEPIIMDLYSEIKLSIDYYENQNGVPLEEIFISGGYSNLPNLAGFLNNLFGIPVSKLDVSLIVKCNDYILREELKTSGLFPIALGLALR